MSEILSILKKDKRPTVSKTSALGERGEELASDFLKRSGYRIVLKNFKVPVGRNSKGVQVTGEIDIIAIDEDTLCFVEVKTRRSDEFTPVITNVDLRKQRQITRTSRVYRRIFSLLGMPHRFDVVTVLLPKHAEPKIDLIKGHWTESVFHKKRWENSDWQSFL